jgi:hypothetical protein
VIKVNAPDGGGEKGQRVEIASWPGLTRPRHLVTPAILRGFRPGLIRDSVIWDHGSRSDIERGRGLAI